MSQQLIYELVSKTLGLDESICLQFMTWVKISKGMNPKAQEKPGPNFHAFSPSGVSFDSI